MVLLTPSFAPIRESPLPGERNAAPGQPRLSVIVPAHQAATLLPDTLGALRNSTPPDVTWELIVVDDGSSDGTAVVADRWADRVVRLSGPPRGPAGARNAGADAARGEWLLFIDADVRVHPETLRVFWQKVAEHQSAGAIFGTYDASPRSPGLISRYRNLLHRYIHLSGAGPSETFWAGLGGVRAATFKLVGGFDSERYRRPQIEDIEFGYRLRDGGTSIVLDPAIQGTHLKGWSFGKMALTDFRDRAIPWMRLLLARRGQRTPTLNAGPKEQRRVAVAGAALAATAAAAIWSEPRLAGIGLGLFVLLIGLNLPVYRWFAKQGGVRFAGAVIPLHLWYYLSNAVAATVAILIHLSAEPKSSAGQPAPWRFRHWAAIVAILLAAGSLGWLTRAPEVAVGGDEPAYVILSHSLENGRYHDEYIAGTPRHAKYPPGNPIWIALVRGVLGPDLDGLRGANLLLLLVTALLLGDGVRRLAGPWPGVTGLAMVALNPSLHALSGTAMSETPFVFFTVVALWSTLRADRPGGNRWAALASVMAIASFATRTIGVALVMAIGIWALRRRQWKLVVAHGAMSLAAVGGWFFYAAQVGSTTIGSTYAEDLRHVGQGTPAAAQAGSWAGLLVQVATNAKDYFNSLRWTLGVPTVGGLRFDHLLWVIGLGLFGTIGLLILGRRWPVAATSTLLSAGVLLVWPWFDERMVVPLVPVLIAALVLGGHAVAQLTSAKLRLVILGGLAIAPGVAGLSTLVRQRSNFNCDRRNPYADAACFRPERRAMVAAARSIQASAVESAVVATTKPASVYYFSGHRTLSLGKILRDEQRSGGLNLGAYGVDLILLSRVDPFERREAGRRLARHCADLEIRAELPTLTMVLAARDPLQGQTNACAALARYNAASDAPR